MRRRNGWRRSRPEHRSKSPGRFGWVRPLGSSRERRPSSAPTSSSSPATSGIAQRVLGSVASSLIRVAQCPVMVVGDRGEEPDQLTRVLAAVDLSAISRNVLHNAVVAAATVEGQVRVLSLFEPPILRPPDPDGWLPKYIGPEELQDVAEHRHAEVSALIRRSVPRNAVTIEVEVQGRQPVPEGILEHAREWCADLVVIGSSGNNAWHRMILGSTTPPRPP